MSIFTSSECKSFPTNWQIDPMIMIYTNTLFKLMETFDDVVNFMVLSSKKDDFTSIKGVKKLTSCQKKTSIITKT